MLIDVRIDNRKCMVQEGWWLVFNANGTIVSYKNQPIDGNYQWAPKGPVLSNERMEHGKVSIDFLRAINWRSCRFQIIKEYSGMDLDELIG